MMSASLSSWSAAVRGTSRGDEMNFTKVPSDKDRSRNQQGVGSMDVGSMERPRGSPAVPPKLLARICEDAAQGIAGALLGQVSQVVEDMRRQYKDHCEVLARQELVLQHVMSQLGSYGSPQTPESTSVFGCGLCQNHPGDLGNGYPHNLSRRGSAVEVISGDDEAIPSLEDVSVEQQHWQVASAQRKRKGAPREVQQWVAQQLAEQIDQLGGPRPQLPPPPPPDTPRGMNSKSAVKTVSIGASNVELVEDDDDKAETAMTPLPSSASKKGPVIIAPDEHRSSESSEMNPPLGRCGGDHDDDEDKRLSNSSKQEHERHSRPSQRSANSKNQLRQSAHHEIEQHKLFGDMGMDKSQLDKEEYNVAQFYWDTGYSQKIARSDQFGNITLGVIFLNALYIGYDADANTKENLLKAQPQFIVCEYLFCLFFFFEWSVRFFAFRSKLDCMKDMWFKFDTVLVTMMIIETWILPVALSGGTGIPSGLVKLVRLLRLARMARIMRAFPDLVAMIKGVKVASRAVSSALLMLIGLIYVFAIIMFTLLKDESNESVHERFRRLGITMWTLLIDGTFLDGIGFVSRSLMDTDHYFSTAVLLVFVLLSALTVMNMLIGVLCEVVAAVATAEKEDSAIRMVKTELLSLLRALDEDGSGMISRSEIGQVLEDETALTVLESLQVDVSHLLDHLEMFFDHAEENELTIHQIMDLILMLRGDRPPTMKDMLHGQTFSRWKTGLALDEVKKLLVSVHSRVSYAAK